MPLYDFECNNKLCVNDLTEPGDYEPFPFEKQVSLSDLNKPVLCPKCELSEYTKKVIKTAVPRSKSWGV